MAHRLRFDDETTSLPPAYTFDDGLVVDCGPGRGLVLLNGSARFIWERRARKMPPTEIVRALAEAYALPAATATEAVASALDHWAGVGMFEIPSNATTSTPPAGSDPDTALPEGVAEVSGTYRLGPAPVRVSFGTPELAASFAGRFAHTETRDAEPAGHLRICQSGGHYSLVEAGRVLLSSAREETVNGAFMKRFLELSYGRDDWLAVLHAAALRFPSGQVIAFPALSGVGKSTLALALSRAGCSYLSDDCVPIASDGMAIPVPFAICLKSRGRQQDPADRQGPLAAVTGRARQARRRHFVIPDRVSTEPARLDRIVFLDRQPARAEGSGAPGLVAVPRTEALQELFARRAWVSTEERSLVRFLTLMERTPAFRLTYSTSEEALAALGMLAEAGS